FKVAVACGNLECSHGLVVGAMRFGIGAWKMSANDLLVGVAFNTLSSSVPASHNACPGQQVNGVVIYAMNKQPELFLARAQNIFGFLFLSKVARNDGIAEQAAVVIVHRFNNRSGPKARAIFA